VNGNFENFCSDMGQMILNSELFMTQYKNTDIALQKFQNQYEHKWQQQSYKVTKEKACSYVHMLRNEQDFHTSMNVMLCRTATAKQHFWQ
jgi:hypothetical protein